MDTLDTVNINENIDTEPEAQTEPMADGSDAGVSGESGDGSAPSAPEFDPRQWGYKYRGQEMYPKDRNHLITLAQQGHMATQRMAELNKRAAELDEMSKRFGPYQQLDEVFQKNPKFAQQIWDLYQRAQAGEDVVGSSANGGEAPYLGQLTQELNTIKSEFQRLKEEREDQALQKEVDSLKSSHPDHEWGQDDGDGTLEKRIMQHALDGGFSTLESAYRDMFFDQVRTNAEAAALKRAKENRIAEKKAGVIDKSGSGQRPAQRSGFNVRDASWNQIAEAAIKGL